MSRSAWNGARAVLVDAHNVIHSDAELRRLRPIENARRELEKRLHGRAHVLLFYDGGPGGEPAHLWRNGVRVDYSGLGEADDAIAGWLRDHPGTRTVVVSDDRELRARARALGARLATTADFLGTLRRDQPKPPSKPDQVPEAELRMWLDVFGEDLGKDSKPLT